MITAPSVTTALRLRELEPGDEASFRAAVASFERTDPGWDFAFDFGPQTDFDAYVARLRRQREGLDLPEGFVPATYLVGVVGGRVVGRVSLRHRLNDFLRSFGGHIGYGVIASCRRRGYATQMLRHALPWARRVGLDRVLVTCDDDNLGSSTIIERCGGQLEDLRPTGPGTPPKRRYWIDLAA